MRQIILISLLAFSTAAIAEDQEVASKNRLQLVMMDLLTDTQLLTEGVFKEDFELIAKSAERIANHPNPGPEILQQVKKNLASEMSKFKQYDVVVHNAATLITELAANKDLVGVLSKYHTMIDGCQGCHSQFKQRISVILSNK